MSFLALCAFVNRLGLEASSGYGVACKIVNFAMLVPSALMQSMASFVSQNIGAGKAKRAKKSMFTGIGVGLVVGCIVFLLVMFGAYILAWVRFTNGCSRYPHGSIESLEIDDDMIAVMNSSDRICRHLHLPLQAGSDAVLKAMNVIIRSLNTKP